MGKKLFTTVAASALLVYGVGNSAAADIPMVVAAAPAAVAAPAPAPAFTWDGGYVGGHAGMVFHSTASEGIHGCFGNDDDDDDDTLAFLMVPNSPIGCIDWGMDFDNEFNAYQLHIGPNLDDDDDAFSLNGYLAGAQIGFRRQFGPVVIGAEVAHSVANIGTDIIFHDAIGPAAPGYIGEFEINNLTTATATAGLGLGRVLIYGEAGLALGQGEYSNGLGFSETDMGMGFVFGGGVEVAIGHSVSLFVEYNRVMLNHAMQGTMFEIGTGSPYGAVAGFSSVLNIVKGGFNIAIGN